MRILLKGFAKDFNYTWQHKKAILRLEKELLGRITINGILHDTDKLFLYLIFTKKETGRIHRKHSHHHKGNHRTKKDIINAIIDWESARYTKPDKQETAKEYLLNNIPELTRVYKPFMEELGLW